MNFQDEEYEGINLKIPYWFYSINKEELKPLLDNLLDFFDNKALSNFHPDNQRNIRELEDIENKKQIMADRFEADKTAKLKREKYNDDLLSGDVYEIEWIKKTDISNIDGGITFVTKDGVEQYFSTEEIVTSKYSLNQKTIKLYEKLKDNLDIIKTTRMSDLHLIGSHMDYYSSKGMTMPEENIRLENLSADVWNLRLTFSIRTIKVYSKHKNGKIYYTNSELYFDTEKKCLCFSKGKEFVYLENYKDENFRLRKISEE